MHRVMLVPPHCRRCYRLDFLSKTKLYYRRTVAACSAASSNWLMLHGAEEGAGVELEDGIPAHERRDFFPAELYDEPVLREVFLPVEILRASASLINKSGATAIYGAKPPNDWLQVANLVTQGQNDDDYAYALCTVGAGAITDEVTCRVPPMTCSQFIFGEPVSNRAAGSDPVCGYAWTRYRPVEDPAAVVEEEEEAAPVDPNVIDVAPPTAPLPPPPGLEDQAVRATMIDEQMGAHVEGELLHSSTVVVEHGDHVKDTRTAEGEVGKRTARTRFPKTSEAVEYLFSNDPENLISSEGLRNVDVGVADLTPEQSKAFDEAVAALKKHLFTKKRIHASERYISKTTDVLPKNRTEEKRAQMHIDALNATGDETVPFSLLVDAFCKKEVTKKPKPRPIANHGDQRVWGMAKTAAIFEDVMFHALPFACIKHCEKESKMNDLFTTLNDYGYKFENDLTAFEFGIYDRLKRAECDIFKHVLGHIDTAGDNTGFCHRVIDARDKSCTWVLRYTDAAGAKCVLKLELPRSMRESGDRVTSSGNFFQNLLAWLTLMVKPGKVEAAVQSLIRNKGKSFTYVSARDGRSYEAFLAFEGDDTLGGLNEKILMINDAQLCKEFFKGYGWNAKLKVPPLEGAACINFVGYTALIDNGNVIIQGANVVMFPEVRRVLHEKAWTSTDIPDVEFHPSVAVYATTMMNSFRHFEPMYRFFLAMRTDHIAKGGKCRRVNGLLKDNYIRAHGEVGTDEEILSFVPEPSEFLEGGIAYFTLATVHAGFFTAEEYAAMTGLTTLEVHGKDLACLLPKAWLS